MIQLLQHLPGPGSWQKAVSDVSYQIISILVLPSEFTLKLIQNMIKKIQGIELETFMVKIIQIVDSLIS